MRDLIARLESATGPDRGLDAAIRETVGLVWREDFYVWSQTGARYRGQVNFTASLDAALTLVPEGWAVHSMMIWPGNGTGLMLWGTHEFSGERWHGKDDPKVEARHMHAPIALCIAALRARITTEPPDADE
jgi:hypothetical protein